MGIKLAPRQQVSALESASLLAIVPGVGSSMELDIEDNFLFVLIADICVDCQFLFSWKRVLCCSCSFLPPIIDELVWFELFVVVWFVLFDILLIRLFVSELRDDAWRRRL